MSTKQIREEQMQQAEELLFSGDQKIGFAKGLFFGRFVKDWILPYPTLSAEEAPRVAEAVEEVSRFVREELDAEAIDRQADIPRATIDRLGELGVLGMAAPAEFGGRGFGQLGYCHVLEAIGTACASTSVFVNAHHSIGLRSLVLFGTDEQKQRWLPRMTSGESLGAFALTEEQAGSDASNVQTTARLSEDGTHYILNGTKRYITNGGIAQVVTVMARNEPVEDGKPKITAFLATPDMEGFEVVNARMEKMGIRGTATAKLAFHNMKVPKENVLGDVGKGLKIALNILNFGRTTFGATCTGAAKTCLEMSVRHAKARRQFKQSLSEFELVKKKIAQMAAWIYAMEAMTHVTAGFIDTGHDDYMLETAMLKVYTTEVLWTIVNDAFQIHGGAAYFTDNPLERMLRDARINQIGEGANEVLMSFIALVGMRGPGEILKNIYDSRMNPFAAAPLAAKFLFGRAKSKLTSAEVPLKHPALQGEAKKLSGILGQFNSALHGAMISNGEALLDRQLVLERIANMSMDLFAISCVLSRLDSELPANTRSIAAVNPAADLLLKMSYSRIEANLAAAGSNNDDAFMAAADQVLSDS